MGNQGYSRHLNSYTKDKLFVAVISALRTYDEFDSAKDSGNSLERIIESSVSIYKEQRLEEFDRNMIRQLRSILCLNNKQHEERTSGFVARKADDVYIITSCFGEYHKFTKLYMEDMLDEDIIKMVGEAQTYDEIQYQGNGFAVHFTDNHGGQHVAYLRSPKTITEWDKNLIDIFCANVVGTYDLLYVESENDTSLREIVFALGEVVEARTRFIGNHVKRVSDYVRFISNAMGLSEIQTDLMASAAPIHDIGKLSITDRILNKPGRLSAEEYDVVKEHALAGFEMLKNTEDPLLKMASEIAITHHEKYDGSGYPYGLAGDAIPISGRIMALVDVVDALSSDSVYKKAWPMERIVALLKDEKGKHFDPEIVDVFLENQNKFEKLKS